MVELKVCVCFQLLLVFQKHKELIKRSTVSKELQPERETLLTRLLDYCRGINTLSMCTNIHTKHRYRKASIINLISYE